MNSSELPNAERRRAADRALNRSASAISFVLLAWLAIGFFREPVSSWQERLIVGVLAFCFAIVVVMDMAFRRTLPALDRTPRRATVTGREPFHTDPDSDSDLEPYELITVTVDVDGTPTETMIADIVAAESLPRFTVGSIWNVYAFEDPTALNNDHRTRVILTEAHDDVIRAGSDLGLYSVHNAPGPGSDLLLRRYRNDPRRSMFTTSCPRRLE
ncbi:MAG TPA: hypothetical protein VFN32_14010 [Rhodococcus sp. (in: high G+C Gram-positive bacteria)]|nr:hypothetical protein [Rhodococcus sp. (in: high G+C Gram-positive bacteria)]